MKAVISHDIDHLTVAEHLFRDLIVPKFMVRSQLEWISGKIGTGEYFARWGELFSNKWNNLDELIRFNSAAGFTSSFFIGVDRGVGLNYSLEASGATIARLKSAGCEIGLHGIHFATKEEIQREHDLFRKVSGIQHFGVRMHYVRMNENTLTNMSSCGFTHDSSVSEMRDPYRVGSMWEFPIQIMDSWIMENGKSWQSRSLDEAKDATKKLIDEARQKNLQYLSIDFHDRYFSGKFATWMNWYSWLVDYLKSQHTAIVTFEKAVEELNRS